MRKQFKINKALNLSTAIINAAQAQLSILAQYPKFDGGIAMAAALVVTGIATAVNIAKIASTQYQPKSGGGGAKKATGSAYAQGGLLGGPSHDLGGIKTSLGELEGGEFVMNRRATANFLPLLNQINALGNTPGPQVASSQQTPIIKTYVVATDMTSQQEANSRLNALARL